jgi:thymidylate synthase ThyX
MKKYGRLSKLCYNVYSWFLDHDLTRELSRCVLPVNYYTECYWKIDLNNLLKTLYLRTDAHAQKETQVFAEAMESFLKEICPLTYEAYIDYIKEAKRFSRMETDILRSILKEYDDLRKSYYYDDLAPNWKDDFVFKASNFVTNVEQQIDKRNLVEKYGMSAKEEAAQFYSKIGISPREN